MYPVLQSGFIEDDQEHDVSVVALSVQMLTVPPIARSVEGEGIDSGGNSDCVSFIRNTHSWGCLFENSLCSTYHLPCEICVYVVDKFVLVHINDGKL